MPPKAPRDLPPETPRAAAARLLDGVLGDGRMLSEMALDGLSPADRARATRLAGDTLRHLSRADAVLAPFLHKLPPLAARNLLRLGTMELCTGGDAHGVVNDIVTLVGRTRNGTALRGMANAVLRRVATLGPEAWAAAPVPRLPDGLRRPLIAAWGRDVVRAIEARIEAPAPIDLTARHDPAALAERLGAMQLETGSVRLPVGTQISALDGYDTGAFWVQDAAAALPARLLSARQGETVLDLCAAPGGKTMQLAESGADVTALDVSERRLERLRANLHRTGLGARVIVADALTHKGRYDAVLLDAPCSATGTLRRHPDLPHIRGIEAVQDLAALQSRMIDHALTLLVPGGRLVFCTCSLLPAEGEDQTRAALERHPGLRADTPSLPGIPEDWRTPEGGIRTRPDFWPDIGGIDGFYMVRFRKA